MTYAGAEMRWAQWAKWAKLDAERSLLGLPGAFIAFSGLAGAGHPAIGLGMLAGSVATIAAVFTLRWYARRRTAPRLPIARTVPNSREAL